MRKFEIHELDLAGFVNELKNCKGAVWLTTEEGDKIKLQSALSRIIGIMNIIEGGKLSRATIECELLEDESRLFRYNLYGKSQTE